MWNAVNLGLSLTDSLQDLRTGLNVRLLIAVLEIEIEKAAISWLP